VSPKLPVDGVQLIVEGAKKFVDDLKGAKKVWEKTIGDLAKGAPAAASASKGLTALGVAGKAAGVGLAALGAAATVALAAVAAIGAAIAAVGVVSVVAGKKLFALAVQASELQGVSMQFAILTQNIEGGSKGMLNALQDASGGMVSMRDLMTKFNDAASLVNLEFAQKLPQAMGLLTKVSAATGTDVNYLLDSLVKGVGRVSPMILDNLKIQVGVAEATAYATEMFGKEAEALTKSEQQAAMMELTLTKLEEKFGALPDTTQTLAAQTAVLDANFQDIGDTLGTFFIPAATTLMEAFNKIVTAFKLAISEGGALEPILIKIGAVLSILADGVGAFADFFVGTFNNLASDASVGISGTIESALQWGIDLIAAFATGITNAVSTTLVGAMNFISDMLTSWLAPGSPPKVAQGIVGWGIDLMDMYLQGMTEADFGILEDIQGPLKKILSGPAFADVSKTLAEALAGGDRAGFLETVGQAAGPLGDALKQLASANFDLADSVTAVQTAEDALAASREKLLSSQAGINKATVEYNRLLRAGASENELQTQLGLINASEDNMRAAIGQVGAQEDALDAAKKRQEELEAEEKLQQNIVDQLLQVNDALKEQEKETAKAGVKAGPKAKAGAPIETPAEVLGIPEGMGLGGRIGASIDAMKLQLQEKFKGMFEPITTAWDNMVKKVSGLGTVWDEFKVTVGEAWTALGEKYPILQDIQAWVENLPGLLQTLGSSLKDDFLSAMTAVGDYVRDVLKPLFDSFVDFSLAALNLALIGITALWKEEILPALQAVWKEITDYTMPIFQTLSDFLSDLWENVISKLADGFTNVTKALKSLTDWFNKWTKKLKEMTDNVEPIEAHSPSPLEKGLAGINKQMQILATTRMPALANMGSQMAGALAPTQMLAPQSSTAITMNMGGNTFNGGASDAVFNARVEQSLRRNLRR